MILRIKFCFLSLFLARLSLLLVFSQAPTWVRYQSSTFQVSEGDQSAHIELVREGNLEAEVKVRVQATPSRAGYGFMALDEEVTFAAGISNIAVPLKLIDDQYANPSVVVGRVSLTALSQNVSIRFGANLLIYWLENDPGVEFRPASFTVSSNTVVGQTSVTEDAGTTTLQLVRVGPSTGEIRVSYFAEDQSARQGIDFNLPPGEVLLPSGVRSAAVPLLILNNDLRDGERMFSVWLTNVSDGASISIPRLDVQIKDDEVLGVPGTLAGGFPSDFAPCGTVIEKLQLNEDGTYFVQSDCSASRYIYKLRPEGSRDLSFAYEAGTWDPAWAAPDGTVYVERRNGLMQRLIRLQPTGEDDPAWSHEFDGPIEDIYFVEDGSLFVLGRFQNVNGAAQDSLARIKSDGTLDSSFHPNGSIGLGTQAKLARLHDGSLLIVEAFSRSIRVYPDGRIGPLQDYGLSLWNLNYPLKNGGTILSRFARSAMRIMPDGALDPVFSTAPDMNVILQFQDGRYLTWNTRSRKLFRTFADGTIDSSFVADVNGEVHSAVQAPDGFLIIGGRFTQVNGRPQPILARLYYYEPTGGPILTWNASKIAASESGETEVVLLRDGNASQELKINYFTKAGSALAGEDFLSVQGSVQFASGERFKRIKIPIMEDFKLEAEEQFQVQFELPVGVQGGLNEQVTVHIVDDDSAISFGVADQAVSEPEGYASLTVERRGGLQHPALFEIVQRGGTAQSPKDFVLRTNSLRLPPGRSSTRVDISIHDNAEVTGHRDVIFELKPNGTGLVLGQQSESRLEIRDSDRAGFSSDGLSHAPAVLLPYENSLWMGGTFNRVHGQSSGPLVMLNQQGRVVRSNLLPEPWTEVVAMASASEGQWVISANAWAGTIAETNKLFLLSQDGMLTALYETNTLSPSYQLTKEPGGSVLSWNRAYGELPARLYRLYPGENRVPELLLTNVSFPDLSIAPTPEGGFWMGGKAQVSVLSTPDRERVDVLGRFGRDGALDVNVPVHEFRNALVIPWGDPFNIIALSNGSVLVFGRFNEVDGTSSPPLVRLTRDGNIDSSLQLRFDAGMLPVDAIYAAALLPGEELLVVAGSQSNFFLIKLDQTGTQQKSFGTHAIEPLLNHPNPSMNYAKFQIAVVNATIFLTGTFSAVDGQERFRIARLSLDGKLLSSGPVEFGQPEYSNDGEWRFPFESRLSGLLQLESSTRSQSGSWEKVKEVRIDAGFGFFEVPRDTASTTSRFFRMKISVD